MNGNHLIAAMLAMACAGCATTYGDCEEPPPPAPPVSVAPPPPPPVVVPPPPPPPVVAPAPLPPRPARN